jgi:hypothetical protein
VLGAVSVLAMTGGLVAVAAPAASAATVLEACDATLLSSITPPLGGTVQATAIKGSDKTTQTCTGALSGTTGNAITQSASLTGSGSCPALAADPPLPGTYPFNGKMTIKYTTIVDDKNLTSSGYIRLGSSELGLDALGVTGIVTKGIAVGADITGDLGFSPWWDKKFTPAWDAGTSYAKGVSVAYNKIPYKSKVAGTTIGANPASTPTEWTAGTGPAGPEDLTDLLGCVGAAPGATIPYAKAFTDGTTTALATAVSSAITLQFP